jgi:DNA polymerase-1
MVQAIRRDFAPELIAAMFDTGAPSFRKAIYEDYKANRPPPPEDLVPQFPLSRQAIDALGVMRLEQEGLEADDLIATYALAAQAEGFAVTIASSDKDLMQLVQEEEGRSPIQMWDTMKGRLVGPVQVEEKFGVRPSRLGDLLALAGDSSDNIPGVPGIGPKTAATLLAEWGDLEGVLANADKVKQKKRRERLLEHADDARLSRELVALRTDLDLPVPLADLRDQGPEAEKVRAFFGPLGFAAVLREVGVKVEEVAKSERLEDTRTSEAAIELGRIGSFKPTTANRRTILAADEDDLARYVAVLEAAPVFALELALSSDDGMSADILGIALAVEPEGSEQVDTIYVPIAHRGLDMQPGAQLDLARVLDRLRPLLEGIEHAKMVQDHKLPGTVLARNQVELRAVTMDPMLASYALDPARAHHSLEHLASDLLGHKHANLESVVGKGRKRIGFDEVSFERATAYMGERAELTLALGKALAEEVERAGSTVHRLLHHVELPLATVLRKIEMRGVLLDIDVLHGQASELAAEITGLRERIEEEAGHPVNPDSPPQLQKLLFDERGLPTGRKTKTGYSTDARVLEELSMIDPIVRQILEYRALTKLKGTYLDPLPDLVNPETGRLHTSFRQAVAATGRLSSVDPNLQNVPIRTERGRRIREGFIAPKGRLLVALDYSQIELRILAHLSGDPNLVSAFKDDVDVHRRTAAEVFGTREEKVTDEQRRIAKAVNFGVIYGQTAFGLAQQLQIPRGKAGSYIKTYFEKIPGVDSYMEQLVTLARRRGFAETVLGRKRRIPELRAKGPARAHGERIARNTPIQGSAADILKLAMIAVERALASRPWAEMLLTVHDELIFECDEDRVDGLIAVAKPLMEGAFQLAVPVRVEAGFGRTWAAAKA